VSIFDSIRGMLGGGPTEPETTTPTISVNDLPDATATSAGRYASPVSGIGGAPAQYSWQDGDKFPGGFGVTELWLKDYLTLRQRSSQLFDANIYARGLVRRLVTNVINTGLTLEAFPEESILGMEDGALDEWSELTENRFRLWCQSPHICDYHGQSTFWELQRTAYREALVEGDVLIIMRQSEDYRLPQIQIVPGQRVQTPIGADMGRLQKGHKVEHGVECDPSGRHVAFWVAREEGGLERVPAKGPRTGRRMAWLMYGTDRRHGTVRGDPMLGIVLQSLKELDRYRDSAQRKAVINSMLAMFIKKDADKQGTMPLTGGATRRDQVTTSHDATGPRSYDMLGQIPGLIFEELQEGETPQAFGSEGIDVNYPAFETAILRAFAWANEIPPEILELSFQNNYSASQAATNEFKSYLNMVRQQKGKELCQPVYTDWLISEALLQRIDAPGLLDSWRDPARYDVFAAWVQSDWTAAIKPSIDLVKQARGHGMLLDRGLTTHSRATAEVTGTSFNRNVKRLKREHEQLARAMGPLREAGLDGETSATDAGRPEEGGPGATDNVAYLMDAVEALQEQAEEQGHGG
jgi:lambda family phage portal protein